MGTNFYRIPLETEMTHRKKILIERIESMELTPSNIEMEFEIIPNDEWSSKSPWNEFLEDTKVHLGKESWGWKFIWNFNNNKYYSDKHTLLNFIRTGRVVDEYGSLIPNEEFIKDALEWGQPNGYVYNEEYIRTHPSERNIFSTPENFSKIIDGLVVSSHDEFC